MLSNKDAEVFVLRRTIRWLRCNEKGRPGKPPSCLLDRPTSPYHSRRDRRLTSARCCSATTPMTASSSMPAALGRECLTKSSPISGGRLDPLARKTSPLNLPPPRKTRFGSPLVLSRVHWVEPKLVAEITYLTWTADNLLRHTVYVGLREDKPAGQVRREAAAPVLAVSGWDPCLDPTRERNRRPSLDACRHAARCSRAWHAGAAARAMPLRPIRMALAHPSGVLTSPAIDH
jgi:hypothetical protein